MKHSTALSGIQGRYEPNTNTFELELKDNSHEEWLETGKGERVFYFEVHARAEKRWTSR